MDDLLDSFIQFIQLSNFSTNLMATCYKMFGIKVVFEVFFSWFYT